MDKSVEETAPLTASQLDDSEEGASDWPPLPPPSQAPVLKYGSKGSAVCTLQEALNAAGANPSLEVDGDFGSATLGAVANLQFGQGLSVDGIVGANTWSSLADIEDGTSPWGPPPVPAPAPPCQPPPMTAAVTDVFTKILGLAAPSPGEDLTAALAGVVGAPDVGSAGSITPGDLGSIIGALQAFEASAPQGGSLAERLGALISFYEGQASLPSEKKASASQLVIVSSALSQIGTVIASAAGPDPTDPSGPNALLGWTRLNEYFETSFGNTSYGTSCVQYGEGLPEWCGIFALWANKAAGLPVGDWKSGHGISAVQGFQEVSSPEPGDVGYLLTNQHEFIVVAVDAGSGSLTSVDGNTMKGSVSAQIRTNQRALGSIAGYYRAVPTS